MTQRVLSFLLFIMVFASCSPERKLARKYLENHTGHAVMIVPSFELYKDNLVLDYDTAIKYTPDQLDSMAWAQSTFIRFLSDSIFLTNFTNSLIDGLTRYGYEVYVENDADVFFALSDPKWMINLAQLQLTEEYSYEYRTAYYQDEFYTIKYRKNKVNFSTWLETSRTNSGNMQVLFLESYLEDKIVDLFMLNMIFDYNLAAERDSIGMKHVYKMATQSGFKHAELLFDYFMNDYIRLNLPEGIVDRKFFHYNWNRKKLTKGLNERFDVVN